MGIAASLGLTVEDAVVLQDSNKLTLHLVPCDVLARVAPAHQQVLHLELHLAQQLGDLGAPVAALEPRVEPRVYARDGFAVTLWTYYAPADREISPAEYARTLELLHQGLRRADVPAPRFTDRIESARQLLASGDATPELADDDRALLAGTLENLSRVIVSREAPEQLLHGEPHPGNLLSTSRGPLFIDFETCCRGPIEFDLAHAPEPVGELYAGADQELLAACRVLVLAIVTTWRWDRGDELPNGRRLAAEWLRQIRASPYGG